MTMVYYCSFCGKSQEEVRYIVMTAGGSVGICNECSTFIYKYMLSDSDGSPEGGDGEAGSVRSTTARAVGIANTLSETPND